MLKNYSLKSNNSPQIPPKGFLRIKSLQSDAAKATLKWGFLCAFILFFVVTIHINLMFPLKYSGVVSQNSVQYGVDKRLIYAVIWTESRFDKNAVSDAGAVGLMQLMPSTAKWCASQTGEKYAYNKLFDPKFNIKLGVFYLKYLLDKYGEDGAIAAYNAGEGNYLKWQGKIKFKETQTYIKRVNMAKKIYKLKIY